MPLCERITYTPCGVIMSGIVHLPLYSKKKQKHPRHPDLLVAYTFNGTNTITAVFPCLVFFIYLPYSLAKRFPIVYTIYRRRGKPIESMEETVMKKALTLILALTLVLALFASCGNSGTAEQAKVTATPGEIKTIGDIINTPGAEELQTATVEGGKFVYVYKLNGIYYRAIADVTEEQSDAIWDLDMFADDYDEKRAELLSPLEILSLENLSDALPPQEELDQWVGKTGAELFEAGWYNSGWNLDDMVFWMDYGPFQYDVFMTGEVGDFDEFDEEDINPLVVKSVTYNGQLGDATNLD